jgi:hypothetical protein
VREELLDAMGRVLLHPGEHVGEVLDGVHAVLLARGDERIEHGEVLSHLLVPEKQVVRSSEGNTA